MANLCSNRPLYPNSLQLTKNCQPLVPGTEQFCLVKNGANFRAFLSTVPGPKMNSVTRMFGPGDLNSIKSHLFALESAAAANPMGSVPAGNQGVNQGSQNLAGQGLQPNASANLFAAPSSLLQDPVTGAPSDMGPGPPGSISATCEREHRSNQPRPGCSRNIHRGTCRMGSWRGCSLPSLDYPLKRGWEQRSGSSNEESESH